MKVKEITQRGKPVVLVDGKINGKRKRMFFDTKPQAERWLKAEAKDVTCQQWWIGLSNSDRIDMMNAFERSRSIGFTLLSAVDHFATAGSGKNFLKKCTLGEAVGYAYVDERVKADSPRCRHRGRPEKVFEPSGFLGAKARKGCSKNTLYTLQTVVHSFRDFIGADTQVATITPEMIESWLDAGAWGNTTKEGYNRQVKNLFNWMIKRDYVKDNPASKIEEIIRVEFDPQILTVEQATKFMELTRKESPALLTSAALNLFCGIRPSEVRRLSQQDISFADKEVALKGNQTKTRRRRYVDISDNCLAWMKLGAKLPIANHNHEWAKLMGKAKTELGFEKWPHGCLRHSYCSYYLAAHENAAKAALQAGHTESILFKHYRKLVKKEQAEEFWNVFPEDIEHQFQVVAA